GKRRDGSDLGTIVVGSSSLLGGGSRGRRFDAVQQLNLPVGRPVSIVVKVRRAGTWLYVGDQSVATFDARGSFPDEEFRDPNAKNLRIGATEGAWRIHEITLVRGRKQKGAEAVASLTRGPLHEAFAEQYNPNPAPGLTAPSKPPELVQEIPPSLFPNRPGMQWISGYWGWSQDYERFIWISGCWREVPRGRRWIPGYWRPVDGGRHQWVAGFWIDARRRELTYSPAPPQSQEHGPQAEAPSQDHIWDPGRWTPKGEKHAWTAGVWIPARQDQVWIPDRQAWTPRGVVYLSGYWDYRLVQRGIAFAPAYFEKPVHEKSGYVFSPTVSLNQLLLHLFAQPGYHHYLFGDYYDPEHASRGIHPMV
ncbi:MAG: hypothetical protein N2C14_24200, partial [Planctomycetales bacterium]